MICLDVVCGQNLDVALNSQPVSLGRLQRIENLLLQTLQIMHDEAGVCHGDVHAGNIMLPRHDGEGDDIQTVLLDFSRACFKTELHPQSWAAHKKRDFARLRNIFSGPKARLVRMLSLPD